MAAAWVHELCDKERLVVMAFQPFLNYDGLLDDAKHRACIEKLMLWFKILKVLRCDLIQVPSNVRRCLAHCYGGLRILTSWLRQLDEQGGHYGRPFEDRC